MVVAPRKARRAHDHQAADIAVCRNIADFCETARTEEALALELSVTHAEAWVGRDGQPCWEAHHHEIRRRIRSSGAACA